MTRVLLVSALVLSSGCRSEPPDAKSAVTYGERQASIKPDPAPSGMPLTEKPTKDQPTGQQVTNSKDSAEQKRLAVSAVATNQALQEGRRQMLHAKAADTGEPELDPLVSFLQGYYSDVIKGGKPLVIVEKTTLGALLLGTSYQEFVESLMKQASAEVPAELVKDFCDKNTQPREVWQELGSHVRSRLITREEQHEIFRNGPRDGWKRFYEKYPGSPGIIEVSRVGLNRNKDMAIFYWGFQKEPLNGHGHVLVLKKQGGEWIELPVSIGGSWES